MPPPPHLPRGDDEDEHHYEEEAEDDDIQDIEDEVDDEDDYDDDDDDDDDYDEVGILHASSTAEVLLCDDHSCTGWVHLRHGAGDSADWMESYNRNFGHDLLLLYEQNMLSLSDLYKLVHLCIMKALECSVLLAKTRCSLLLGPVNRFSWLCNWPRFVSVWLRVLQTMPLLAFSCSGQRSADFQDLVIQETRSTG